jgi:hypothetical protein
MVTEFRPTVRPVRRILQKIRNLQPAIIQRSVLTSLILFIDNPEYAALEPALGAVIPADATVPVYEALLLRLQNLAALFAGEKYLYYSHYPNWNDAWDINLYRKRIQIGESTGDRVRYAVDATAEETPASIVWIGLGAAALEQEHLSAAVSALQTADVVIGASAAGNLILLGLAPKAYNLDLPADLQPDDLATAAHAAGLEVLRMPLPGGPQNPDELRRLGIAIDHTLGKE